MAMMKARDNHFYNCVIAVAGDVVNSSMPKLKLEDFNFSWGLMTYLSLHLNDWESRTENFLNSRKLSIYLSL